MNITHRSISQLHSNTFKSIKFGQHKMKSWSVTTNWLSDIWALQDENLAIWIHLRSFLHEQTMHSDHRNRKTRMMSWNNKWSIRRHPLLLILICSVCVKRYSDVILLYYFYAVDFYYVDVSLVKITRSFQMWHCRLHCLSLCQNI